LTDPIAPRDAFPPVSLDEWRKKAGDLDGALYTEADLPAEFAPVRSSGGWQIWSRADTVEQARAELEGGADGIWYAGRAAELSALDLTEKTVVLDEDPPHEVESRELYVACNSSVAAHERGADAAMEIATLLAAAPVPGAYLRVAVGRDVFEEIAKLRALRLFWSSRTGKEPFIHAVCSHRTLTRVDPWVNMMRVTTQAFAAAVGGADAITTNAYDAAGVEPRDLGRRIARNTQLILREESGLGMFGDAACGSYSVESRTRELLDRANEIQELNWAWDDEAVRTRRQPITGVSAFPSSEAPLPKRADAQRHDADPFEELRDRAAALPRTPTIQIVKFGTAREYGPAFAFARDLFLAGGFEIVETDAPLTCVCGPAPATHPGIIAEDLMREEFDAVALLDKLLTEVGA